MLLFFPAPYPDEILHSVICRYHSRSGNEFARQTHAEIWGKFSGKKLFMPDGIGNIARQIPSGANIPAERLIEETTILPLLKPFFTKSKYTEITDAMKFGAVRIYNSSGILQLLAHQHQYLRFCNTCVEEDTAQYGEPYWHRLHQLPGVYFCPKHETHTFDSEYRVVDLENYYIRMRPGAGKSAVFFSQPIKEQLIKLAQDMEWLLENGSRLDCSERTTALYDNWLRVLDYRTREGKTNLKSLAAAIVGYYGQEFLELMNAYTSGACSWLKYHFLDTQKLSNPIHHLLLMRFLCGSPENFFAGSGKNTPEYLPYGKPPYPCLNRICDHYLQDVIENVEIVIAHVPHGTFACPHCGFTYRRKGKLEKEKQYATTAQTVKYGWKWEELVTGMLLSGKPLSVITKQAHSGFYTVLSFGIQNGLIEAKEHITKSTTHSPTPQLSEPYKNDNSIERCERYRTRFVSLRAENPYALRNALVLLDAKCCKWLYENDRDWFEQHAPPKFSDKENWSERDAEYAERIEIAINQIRDAPGRPQRLSLKALAKASGISTLRLKLATGKYPRTESLIMANRETAEQWQKRKIIWAVREMSGKGISLTISKVLNLASVGYEQCTHLGGFVAECIEQNR